MSDSADSKLVEGVVADDGGQQPYAQPPQCEGISDEEEDLSEETESLPDTTDFDEPDFGKEKVKSLSALTSELITGEAIYLASLECIVDGYIPAWDQPYLAAFLVGKKEIIFSNLANIFEFQKQFYMELLSCNGVHEICQCFKSHEEGFSLYLVYLKSLPQGKKVLSEYGGNFFEMVRNEKRYSRPFDSNYLHTNERLNQYKANFKEMMNAAQKEELHSVNTIRDTLKIFQRIDRIAAFTCITGNLETLDENGCLLMDDFMVYTVKKKKKRAEEMRVFLHESYIIFTKATDGTEERGLSKHRTFEYLYSIKVNCLKLSETVEKGKHPDKFGLAEDKAGPDRECILQPIGKCVEVKQEWCTEVNRLLLQQMEKLKQAQAHISGSKAAEALPPPMTHVVELPAKYQKYIKRDSEGARTSTGGRDSKHDSKHESSQPGQTKSSDSQAKSSDGQAKSPPGNEQDIRRIQIKRPQPLQASSTSDRIIMYETTAGYDGSGKEGHLTLNKGCQVEVLDKSSTDFWLVCTVAETCNQVEKEGFVPMNILKAATRRQASQATSKLVSPPSSVPERFSHLSTLSSLSEQSTAIPKVPLPTGTGKISHPILPPTTSPPVQQQKVYFAIKNYHPDKEGYVHLIAGESVEVLDKSNPEEWVIATVGNETRPSEEGHVPASLLSAEYIPVRYDSLQDRCCSSSSENEQGGVDRQASKQDDEPPPLPPNHPNHDDDTVQSPSGGHDTSEKETGMADPSSHTENAPLTENPQTEDLPTEGENKGDDERQPLPSNHNNSSQGNSSEVVKSSDVSGGVMDSHHDDTSSTNAEGEMMKQPMEESQEQSLSSMKMDSFEEIEVYVAIADYTAQENCNISLCTGQHVQVLDSNREDWWLVLPMGMIGDESSSESPKEGWVPANHLEKLT